MRAVVQRVTRASVTVAGEAVGGIGPGLLVLVGVTHTDTVANAAALARKVYGLRVFPADDSAPEDESRAGERSVGELDGAAVLVVSQFTLYGDARKGRRPSWSAAAPGATAEPLVDEVVLQLRNLGTQVATGRFGAEMQVELINNGPMTLVIDC